MNTKNLDIIERMKGQISDENLTWVFSALREDPITWDSLQDADFGSAALAQAGSQPLNWSPGGISLTAIGYPTHLDFLQAQPMRPLKTELRQLAAQTFEEAKGMDLEKLDAPERLAHWRSSVFKGRIG